MDTWLEINEFCKVVNLEKEIVARMVEEGELKSQEKDGILYVEASKGAGDLVLSDLEVRSSSVEPVNGQFAEKAIGTILNMHEKVLDAKEETLDTLKNENRFLKEALFSMQELYDEDRKTVETLTSQLKHSQNEVEFLKRKYKLMWNKAIDNYTEKG